jgi:hypothetical protein
VAFFIFIHEDFMENETKPEQPKQDEQSAGAKKATIFDFLSEIKDDDVDKIFAKSPVLASFKDRYFAKNLEEWKKKNLDGYYQDRYTKEHPAETEEQKRLRVLEQKLTETENREKRQVAYNKALKFAQDNQIPNDLLDFVVGEDSDVLDGNLQRLKTILQGYGQQIKEELLKVNGRGVNKSEGSGETLYTKAQMEKLTPEEQAKNTEKVFRSLAALK